MLEIKWSHRRCKPYPERRCISPGLLDFSMWHHCPSIVSKVFLLSLNPVLALIPRKFPPSLLAASSFLPQLPWFLAPKKSIQQWSRLIIQGCNFTNRSELFFHEKKNSTKARVFYNRKLYGMVSELTEFPMFLRWKGKGRCKKRKRFHR